MSEQNQNPEQPEITNEMRDQVQTWVDQGVETYGSGWAKFGITQTDTDIDLEPVDNNLERPPYPSEQARKDRAIRAELLIMANEYPGGRVAYLCLPENREEALRLGLISPEDIE